MCIIGIFLIASASAADLNETTTDDLGSSHDGCRVGIGEDQQDSSIDVNNLGKGQVDVISANHTPFAFNEIQNSIDAANDGDNIILDGSYIAGSTDAGVIINKTVNFIGINNAVVDGDSKIRLFEIKSSNVTFKNITFKNGYSSSDGGAIYSRNDDFFVENCTFIDNYARYGGAISNVYCQGIISNCSFINNSAEFGGVVYGTYYYYLTIRNSSFINNSANTGGAIYYGNAENCYFFANNATNYGGAIGDGLALNCTFIGNTALNYYGGALSQGNAIDCIFINNSAKNGGAIDRGNVENCTFTNNHASNGGAICSSHAENCTFTNNHASNGGAMYDSNAVNCTFINNSASNGGVIHGGNLYECNAVNCTFVNNSATGSGGVMYEAKAINCSFINNSAVADGGAMFKGSAENCSFRGNSARYGGVCARQATIVGCYFANNHADLDGGVLYYCNALNSTFISNFADRYGGAMCEGDAENCIFINNSANLTNTWGGVITASYGGAMWGKTALNCTFISNSADYGGAIFITCPINSTFINNSASYGGAIYLPEGGNVTNCNFINCSLSIKGSAICSAGKIALILCNFTNCSNNCLELKNHTIMDCIFDIPPEGIDYYYSSTLSVDDLVIYYNDDKNFVAKLYDVLGPLSGKTVTFTLNDVDYPIKTTSDGIAEFNIQEYLKDFGNYTVNVNYAGEGNIYSTSSNATIHYRNYKGNLTGSVDGKYFNDTILTYKLVNSRNNVPIPNAQIILRFSNNQEFDLKTNNRGIATFRIPFMPGTYGVVAWVNESYADVNAVDLTDIVIKKIVGVINLSTLNDNHTLRVKLYDDKTLDAFGNVKVMLSFSPNDVAAEVTTDENGMADYEMNFGNGIYYVIASVDRNYKQFEDAVLDNIVISNLSDSAITFTNDIVFDFGGYGSTNFTVDGGTVNRENIRVLNHSEAIISFTGNTITVFGLSVGKYVLMVETTPDEYHNPVSAALNITVNNVKSKVILKTGVVFEYGGSASIHVTVDGGVIESKNIRVLNHPEAKISLGGQVITISGLNVGSYVLSVTSTPDSDHTAATGTVTVTVRKATAVIKASKITVAYKKGGQWTIKFIDSKSKKPIANMKVTLKVYTGKKFKTVNLKTNSKGEATYQTKKLAKGNHKVIVTATDDRYDFNSYSSSIKVVKQTALKFSVRKKIGNDGASLSIIVKNKKTKKGIKGVKIKLLIYTGKKYKTVTLKSMKKGKYVGVCGYGTNKLSVGTHKVKIMPADIKYGGSAKSTMKITKKAKKVPAWETKDSAK